MANLQVIQAVERRLRDNFSAIPILVENDSTDIPNDHGPFITLQFPWARSEWLTTDGHFLEEGAFRLVLAVEQGSGTYQARAWLDELSALFRGVEFDGIQTYAPSPAVTNDNSDKQSYYVLSVSIPYEYIVKG